MIQTEVKKLGDNEYMVHVQVAQEEYDRIYAAAAEKLASSVKLPGFRHGKVPGHVLQKQFGAKLHEDTVSELLRTHYVTAIESSGLTPAVQPELDIPAVQPEKGFEFTLKVETWPTVEMKGLNKLKFDETEVTVEESDIRLVIDRLQESQVRYEIEEGRAAEQGDQVTIDFVGYVDGEAFDGGAGNDVPLVLGEGRFIPGFEDQLIGSKAGAEVAVEVTFPEEYQARHLAGKPARFDTTVKSVGKAVKASSEDELARMLGFDDAAALRADAEERLGAEAENASYQSTRDAALDALLAANEVVLPQRLIEEDARETARRVLQNMQQQGIDPKMVQSEEFDKEIRSRSERGLKLSVLLQSIRDSAKLEVDEAAIDAEIEQLAGQYPADQKEAFTGWFRSQPEQVAQVRERLLERKCVEHIVNQAKTKKVAMSLSEWQESQGNG